MLGLYTQLTAPAEEPLTLSEACNHLRVAEGEDDSKVNMLIKVARMQLDGKRGLLGKCLVTQTWEVTFPALDENGIRLRFGPVQTVDAFEYVDSSGVVQTMDAADYVVVGDHIYPAPGVVWPIPRKQPDAVRVEYTTGFGSASDVPEPLKAAMLLHIGFLYDNRSAASEKEQKEVPFGYLDLIREYREPAIA